MVNSFSYLHLRPVTYDAFHLSILLTDVCNLATSLCSLGAEVESLASGQSKEQAG